MRALLVFPLLFIAAPAQAAFHDGNDLYEWCNGDEVQLTMCAGYVSGIADATELLAPDEFCAPTGVELGQMVDVVSQYLAVFPAKRHFPAHGLVIVALSEAFPCQ